MKLVVIGGSNPTIIRTIQDINASTPDVYDILAVLDNGFESMDDNLLGVPIIGGFNKLKEIKEDVYLVNTVAGSCASRREVYLQLKSLGHKFATIIHPSVNTHHVTIGEGTIVYESAMIHPCVEIGVNNVISSLSGVAHDTSLGDHNFVGPNVYICGRVEVGSCNFFGVSSSVAPRVAIGDHCTIAAGSFINKSLPSNVIAKGVPASVESLRKD